MALLRLPRARFFFVASAAALVFSVASACGGGTSETPVDASAPDGALDGAPDVTAVDSRPPGDAGGGDPGLLRCGAEVCMVPAQACCLEPGQTSADKNCFDADAGFSACMSMRRQCDEAADCPGGQKCCEATHAAAFHIRATECAPKCEPQTGSPGICKTDAECAPQACVFVQCGGEQVGFCGGEPNPGWCRP